MVVIDEMLPIPSRTPELLCYSLEDILLAIDRYPLRNVVGLHTYIDHTHVMDTEIHINTYCNYIDRCIPAYLPTYLPTYTYLHT